MRSPLLVSRMLVTGLLCSLALSACVERKERLSISPHGSVHYAVEHRSDSVKDLYELDAVPRIADGWLARQEVEKDDDGNETFSLIAETAFAAGAELPSNFATRTDPDADLYLQFPTSLKIEQRRDGMYYHFARQYPARQWMQIETLQERHVQAPLADFKDIDPKDWTPLQRETVARALAKFETEKMLVFARTAFKNATPDAPQDGWLAVQSHIRDSLNHIDYAAIVKLLEPHEATPDEQAREEAINAELKGFFDQLNDQLKQSMFKLANFSATQYNNFKIECDRQRKKWEITQDLGDDTFAITVEMPGVIVASNADSVEGSIAKWSFDGQIIRDREMELLVTSRVAK